MLNIQININIRNKTFDKAEEGEAQGTMKEYTKGENIAEK